MIKTNLSYALLDIDLNQYQTEITKLHQKLHFENLEGSSWVYNPGISEDEYKIIQAFSQEVKREAEVFVICGVGGSYLGAKALIEMINGLYSSKQIEIVYIGQSLSARALKQTLDYLENKKFYVNVVSKSGSTLETSLAFEMILNILKKQATKFSHRVIVTCSSDNNALKNRAIKNDFKILTIPKDIGGRYSVLTTVGMLPLAIAGIDIREILAGAKLAIQELSSPELLNNDAYTYALARHLINKKGKDVEILVGYQPFMQSFLKWIEQLFAESEGKSGRGILPVGTIFSTELHSLGQFIQEGTPLLFETLLIVEEESDDLSFQTSNPELSHLNGKTFQELNQIMMLGTSKAHAQRNVPEILIQIQDLTPKTVGYLVYFFFVVASMSSLLNQVCPFDQPGVEKYKIEIGRLLEKYE